MLFLYKIFFNSPSSITSEPISMSGSFYSLAWVIFVYNCMVSGQERDSRLTLGN